MSTPEFEVDEHGKRVPAGEPVPADATLDEDEVEWLRKQLHSPEMQCRQCNLVRRLLDALETE